MRCICRYRRICRYRCICSGDIPYYSVQVIVFVRVCVQRGCKYPVWNDRYSSVQRSKVLFLLSVVSQKIKDQEYLYMMSASKQSCHQQRMGEQIDWNFSCVDYVWRRVRKLCTFSMAWLQATARKSTHQVARVYMKGICGCMQKDSRAQRRAVHFDTGIYTIPSSGYSKIVGMVIRSLDSNRGCMQKHSRALRRAVQHRWDGQKVAWFRFASMTTCPSYLPCFPYAFTTKSLCIIGNSRLRCWKWLGKLKGFVFWGI